MSGFELAETKKKWRDLRKSNVSIDTCSFALRDTGKRRACGTRLPSTFALAPIFTVDLRCGLSTLYAQRMVPPYTCVSHRLQNAIWVDSLSVMSIIWLSRSALVWRASAIITRALAEMWLLP
jgi:hypothetical protein